MGAVTELRVFGPPGTGKTTYLSKQIEKTAKKRGSENIVVASFTRAAAAELTGRKLPVERSQIGTLHALCYRALDRPEIAEGKISEWNEKFPQYRLSSRSGSLDEADVDLTMETQGDVLYNQIQNYRAKMIEETMWSRLALAFYRKWCKWKEEAGYMDFTDLIEKALDFIPTAPGNPEIGFYDEVQDFTKLELSLVRKWARDMELAILAGDDDQAIYSFKGSEPSAFLDPPVPDHQKKILNRSYRVPEQIRKLSHAWVQQLSRREEKKYTSRDATGEVRMLYNANYKNVDPILWDAQEYMDEGKTVMVLATCSYMLRRLINTCKDQGIPFHNPFRRKRGDWNPLQTRKNATTAADRILSYLRPQNDVWGNMARMWTETDFKKWAEILQAKDNIYRGKKKEIKKLEGDSSLQIMDLLKYIEEHVVDHALVGDLQWYIQNVVGSQQKRLRYPVRIAEKHGAENLVEEPKLIIGTGHSVKGGQADVVYLLPDLSRSGMQEWAGRNKDAVIRLLYVMMTRARESLIVCEPAGGYFVDLEPWVNGVKEG